MKAEPTRLIPLKPIENLELLFVGILQYDFSKHCSIIFWCILT